MIPFFSVIITTFNRPNTIQRTIDSIIGQSFKDFEIIIVNDGSSADYTKVQEQIEKHSNITYHYQENTHLSGARNKGVTLSKGRFINFIDDDDYHLPNHLAILHKEIIKNNQADGIYHTYPKILKKNGLEDLIITPRKKGYTNHEYYITDGMITVNCCCFSKNILIEFPFDTSFRIAEEHHQRLRAFNQYPVFEIKEFTSVYDKTTENSLTSNKNISVIIDYLDAWNRIFSNKEVSMNIRKSIRNSIISNYLMLLINNHRNMLSYSELLENYKKLLMTSLNIKTVIYILRTLIWKIQSR